MKALPPAMPSPKRKPPATAKGQNVVLRRSNFSGFSSLRSLCSARKFRKGPARAFDIQAPMHTIKVLHKHVTFMHASNLRTRARHTRRTHSKGDRNKTEFGGGERETSDGEKEAMVLAVCWHRNHSLLVVLGHIFFACRHFARRQHRPPPSDATGPGLPASHKTHLKMFFRERGGRKKRTPPSGWPTSLSWPNPRGTAGSVSLHAHIPGDIVSFPL